MTKATASTPSRRSTRHGVGTDGASASDEDSLAKAMRRKASSNLDGEGISSCKKSFLSFSTPSITAKLDSVGVSLGSSEREVFVSSKALKHMEFDRLKCTPRVSDRAVYSLSDDDEEAYANTDGQLLSHLVGDVSEVGLDEARLGSVIDLKESSRKSKSAAAKNYSRQVKKAKVSKTPIVSK